MEQHIKYLRKKVATRMEDSHSNVIQFGSFVCIGGIGRTGRIEHASYLLPNASEMHLRCFLLR